MVANHEVKLLNQKSFVTEKFNLNTNDKTEIFLIPTFTLIMAPVTSAQNISCYELYLQISYLYCRDFKQKPIGNLINLIFNYDLNFSKVSEGRGQLFLFKKVKFALADDENISTTLLDTSPDTSKKSVGYLKDLKQTIFKILLPTKAVKDDDINILHYNFTAQIDLNPPYYNRQNNQKLHINHKNNSGTLSFYINKHPSYQLQAIPKIISKEIIVLKIKNPIIFQTYIPILNNRHHLTSAQNNLGLINGCSLIDENFTFLFNNLNSISIFPLKVQYFLSNNKSMIEWDTKEILSKLNNFLIHQSQFNLQQNLIFSIDDQLNNIKTKKVNGSLIINNGNSNKEYLFFQEYHLQLNNEIYSPLTNKITNEFPFPLNEKLDFLVSTSFKFDTFFKYLINFVLIEHTNSAIIGEDNSLIKTEISNKKDNEVQWAISDKFVLSQEQIKIYYIGNNFKYDDYEQLISARDSHVF